MQEEITIFSSTVFLTHKVSEFKSWNKNVALILKVFNIIKV